MNHFWRSPIVLWAAAGVAHARVVRVVVEHTQTVGACTHENYVERVKTVAQRLVEQRFLVQEDADRLVREADASVVFRP